MDIDQDKVYQIVGYLVIANISALIGAIGVGIRLVWFLSKMDSRVDEAKSSSVRAHKRIDKLNG